MSGAFAKKQEELEKRLREQELAVLVWGPGRGGGEQHEKRQKIRKALEEHFSKSELRFSEDLTQLVLAMSASGIRRNISRRCRMLAWSSIRPRAQLRRSRTSLAAL